MSRSRPKLPLVPPPLPVVLGVCALMVATIPSALLGATPATAQEADQEAVRADLID